MPILRGYGVLQPGDRQYPLSDAIIKAVDFVVLRDRWSYLEKERDKYDLSYLIAQMKRCMKLKKPFTVSIMTGEDCNPSYLPKKLPWSLVTIDRYERLHKALREEMEKHPGLFESIVGVWITGPTVPSQEMHLNGADRYPGFSSSKMLTAWKQAASGIIVTWEDLPTQFVLSISGQNAVYKTYLDDVIKHVVSLFGKNSVAFQHNSLGTQTSLRSNHHKKLLQLHKEGYRVGAEMVQPGHTSAISKFPEASFIVLYPQDVAKIKSLPSRPKN